MEHVVVRRESKLGLVSLGVALTAVAALALIATCTLTLSCVRGGPEKITCSTTASFWGLTLTAARNPGWVKAKDVARLEAEHDAFLQGDAPSLTATAPVDKRLNAAPFAFLFTSLAFAISSLRKVVVKVDRHTGTVHVVRFIDQLTTRRTELPLSDVSDVVAGKHLPKNYREVLIMRKTGEPMLVTCLAWTQIEAGVTDLRKFLLPE